MAERRQVLIDLITRTGPATAGIARTAGQLTGLQSSATGAKAGLLGVSGGAAVAAVGVAAVGVAVIGGVRAFASFDDKMNESLAIMGNVSDAMRKDMSDAAREVAKTTRFSAEDAAESYFFLASAGLDAEQSIAALPQVAAFAQAGMFDMARATDLATDAQSALGLTVPDAARNLENLTRVTDVFVKANTLANASVEQFSTALTTKAGGALRNLNKDIEEGAAVLAVYADRGIKGERTGTVLAATLAGLTENARKNSAEFKRLGITVFDSTGEMRNMADITADLENALGPLSAEQRTAELAALGFNRRTLEGTLALLGNSEAIREYEGELRQAAGTTQDVADKQMQSLAAQMDVLGSVVTDAGISLGEGLAPGIIEVVKGLASMVEALGPVIGLLGDLLGIAGKLVGGFFTLIGDAGEAIASIWDEGAEAGIRFSEALEDVATAAGEGRDESVAYANGLVHLAKNGALTEDTMRELAEGIEFVGEKQGAAIIASLEWARANGVAADQVALLEDALLDQIQASELTAAKQEELIEAYGLTDAAARDAADGFDTYTEASGDAEDVTFDHTEALTGLESALRDAEDAQESLAAAMRAFVDPTFAAVRALEKLQSAQDTVAQLQADGKEDTDEFAKAQLELAGAVLEAQGSLDAFSAAGVEDQVRVIADALEISEDAARDLLEALGLIDGKTVHSVVDVNFRSSGSGLAQRAVGVKRSIGGGGFLERQHGGPTLPGIPYLVGEAGRELFVPDRPGTVVPHNDTERLIAAMSRNRGSTSRETNFTFVNPQLADDPFNAVRTALAFDSLSNIG